MPGPAPQTTDDDARLRAAVKADDGFFTTFFVSSYSPHVVRWAARRGLTPNQVTVASMALGALAAAAFATGERWGLIAGAVLLQVAFLADCVDGQLARYTQRFSAMGAWLDAVFDRTKEYLVYAGLAIGAARTGQPVWLLAGAAMGLQTARHAMDFSFRGSHDADTAGVLAVARRHDTGPLSWAKKIVVFPIGERFATISLTAAIWSAHTTFVVLLAWGAVAGLYGFAGRVARGRGATPAETLFRYRDDGPFAPLLRHAGVDRRLSWAVPPLLRVLEYGAILALVSLDGQSALAGAFALIAASAYRQYDLIYRNDAPPTLDRRRLAGLGGAHRRRRRSRRRRRRARRALRRGRRDRRAAGGRVDQRPPGGGRPGMIGMVLAAGWGSRLAPLTDALPKTLLPVDGDRTILDVAMGNFAAVGLDEVVIVTGYRHDVLADRRAALERDHGVRVELLFNPRALQWNNAYSLWCAREHFARRRADGQRGHRPPGVGAAHPAGRARPGAIWSSPSMPPSRWPRRR